VLANPAQFKLDPDVVYKERAAYVDAVVNTVIAHYGVEMRHDIPVNGHVVCQGWG
jgi:hypothetical protein